MFFKNLQIYRLPEQWLISLDALNDGLSRLRFCPCGSQDLSTHGWVPTQLNGPLAYALDSQILLCLQTEHRLLPAAVIKQAAAERAAEIKRTAGYKPGRKQMKEIKEAVTQELLPRAFARQRRTFTWIDRTNGWLVVDASTRNAADQVIEALHKSLDKLPLKLLNTERTPASCMTEWLLSNEAPDGFTIDQDCELRAVAVEKSAVRYVHHALDGKEVGEHISSGKQASKLALTWNGRLSFVLTDTLSIKRLQFLDAVTASASDADSAAEQFDSDFALMTGELALFIPALLDALGGEAQA